MNGAPVAIASYGGSGAWSAAELDGAVLESAGIRSIVSGDPHLHAPLFGGHQVVLLVDPSQREDAITILSEGSVPTAERSIATHQERA